jgi:hypothetical protein
MQASHPFRDGHHWRWRMDVLAAVVALIIAAIACVVSIFTLSATGKVSHALANVAYAVVYVLLLASTLRLQVVYHAWRQLHRKLPVAAVSHARSASVVSLKIENWEPFGFASRVVKPAAAAVAAADSKQAVSFKAVPPDATDARTAKVIATAQQLEGPPKGVSEAGQRCQSACAERNEGTIGFGRKYAPASDPRVLTVRPTLLQQLIALEDQSIGCSGLSSFAK